VTGQSKNTPFLNKFYFGICSRYSISCILALSSCQEKQLGAPEVEIDESAPISLTAGTAGTKGLLDGTTALQKAGTTLQVYDYLSNFSGTINGTEGVGYYIDNQLTYTGGEGGSSSDGKWQFPGNRKYYWTKTGTHKFFGYLTKDGTLEYAGTTTWTPADQVLSVNRFAMTPDKNQFDFSYSDIVTRTTDHTAVPLNLRHLFTALAVNIVNHTGVAISNVSVTLTKVHPEQSATINWKGEQVDVAYNPELTDQTLDNASDMSLGTAGTTEAIANNATSQLFSGTDGEYRLLWPQAILATPAPSEDATGSDEEDDTEEVDGQFIVVTYDQVAKPRTAALNAAFKDITALEAGKKYLLTITITSAEVIFNVQVDDLDNKNAVEGSTEPFTFVS